MVYGSREALRKDVERKAERYTMEIQIVTGFFGSGKTTFLNQYIPLLAGKTALIQNEFGDVEFNDALLQQDIPVQELNAGCICCSLAMDFRKGIKEIADKYKPDYILIEPTGMSKLSDVVKACKIARERDYVDLLVTKRIVMVEAPEFEDCMEDFGAFYEDQIKNAGMLFLTHTDEISEEQLERIVEKVKEVNPGAIVYTEDFRSLSAEKFLELVDGSSDLEGEEQRLDPSFERARTRGFKKIIYR